ncbi:MAG: hypothetical protein LBJ92_03065 [Holosporales bacterium]|jgi:hypothetical protein|nr:hypothetical protein [Holosporales bacterium]
MVKKRVILLGLILIVGMVFWIYRGDLFKSEPSPKQEGLDTAVSEKKDSRECVAKVEVLHSDILRAIVDLKQTVSHISPQDAASELEKRETQPQDDSKIINDISKLPNGIVLLITKSPASIAGINPKQAYFELVRRFTGLTPEDVKNPDAKKVLEALQKKKEQKAIDEWAKNEDAEAVADFMKKEADKDSSAISNVVYGFMRRGANEDEYVTYTERYASHPHAGQLGMKREEEYFDKVIKSSKKLDPKLKDPDK